MLKAVELTFPLPEDQWFPHRLS